MKLAVAAAVALAVAPAFAFAQNAPLVLTGPPNAEQIQQILVTLDTNKDGRVTKDEGAQMPLGAFDTMDANHDGLLTAEEIKNAPLPKGPPPQQ